MWEKIFSEQTLITVITSSFVTGMISLFVSKYLDKKNKIVELSIQKRNKEIEIEFQSFKNYKKAKYDLLIDSYNNIWKSLNVLENYFINELPIELMKGTYDLTFPNVKKCYIDFRKEMLFLPQEIYEKTNSIWDGFFNIELNRFILHLEQIKIKAGAEKTNDPELIEEVKKSLDNITLNFKKVIEELRLTFQKETDKIFQLENK
jgi:hypothetical protein